MANGSVVWTCPNCEGEPQFDAEGFRKHLAEVHKITETKGDRKMNMHADARDFCVTGYDWTIGGLTFRQAVTVRRRGR
jgi:hypothetical protein